VEALASPSRGRPGLLQRFLVFWLPVLAYVTLIVTLSAQPGLRPPFGFRNADKMAHIGEYFVLGLLLARACTASLSPRHVLPPVLLAAAIGVGVGAGDETFQRFVPGRDSNVYDLLADTIGVLFGQVVFLFLRKD